MMSRPDFLYKQIIFYQVTEKEKLSFKADNLIIEDSKKTVKLQHSCHRAFALFIVGNITLTNIILKKAKLYGFPIFLLNTNFHLDCVIGNIAEGNTLLRKKQYAAFDSEKIAHELISQKIANQALLLKKARYTAKIDRMAANALSKCSVICLWAKKELPVNFFSKYIFVISAGRGEPHDVEKIFRICF